MGHGHVTQELCDRILAQNPETAAMMISNKVPDLWTNIKEVRARLLQAAPYQDETEAAVHYQATAASVESVGRATAEAVLNRASSDVANHFIQTGLCWEQWTQQVTKYVRWKITHSEWREEHITRYGFPVVTRQAIQAAQEATGNRPLVEVGAGGGYLALEFRRAGQDVIPTEPFPGAEQTKYLDAGKGFRQPEEITTERCTGMTALQRYPDRDLLWSWPDLADYTSEVLEEFRGRYFVYIGEAAGGCTGSGGFHETLERDYDLITTQNLPNFHGIYDQLFVYLRTA